MELVKLLKSAVVFNFLWTFKYNIFNSSCAKFLNQGLNQLVLSSQGFLRLIVCVLNQAYPHLNDGKNQNATARLLYHSLGLSEERTQRIRAIDRKTLL